MKQIFSIYFLTFFYAVLFSNFLFSQNKAQSLKKIKIELSDTIKIQENSFKYLGKGRTIYDINAFLKSKIHEPENEIVRLVELSEKTHKNEKNGALGFVAMSVGTIILAVAGDVGNAYFFTGVPVMAVGSGFCLFYSIHQHTKRYTFTKQAVKLYNQRF